MSLTKSFARIRLNSLLGAQAFGMVGALVPRLADLFVSGNVVGVDALSGIAAILPVTMGALFIGKLVYCGAGYLFARYQGEFQHDKAREVAGLTLEMAALVGLFIFMAMYFGRDLYLDQLGLAGSVREQAVAYWRWTAVYMAVFPSVMVMWRLVYADGETVTTAIADFSQPFFTLALSIPLAKATGSAGGAALGTLISELSACSIMMLHLFRKSNSIKPKWCFSFSMAKELVVYSLPDSASRLCQCGFVSVVNKLVVSLASPNFLPVVGVVALLMELGEALDKIGDAYAPIAEMYLGERNRPRLLELVRYSVVVSIFVGTFFSAAILAFAPQIVAAYGISHDDEIFRHAVLALRIGAFVLPFNSVTSYLESHCLTIGRVALAFVATVLEEFVMPVTCALALALLWGVDALWGGLPLGVSLALISLLAYCKIRDHSAFPLPQFPEKSEILNLSFVPSAERIAGVRDETEAFLSAHGIPHATVMRIALLVEECAMALIDNNGKKAAKVIAEGSFTVAPGEVRVVFRDTGDITDITDEDAKVSSLRSFVIAGLMQAHRNRQYLSTIGCNRSMFSFPLEMAGAREEE